jgi:hypothetical protein
MGDAQNLYIIGRILMRGSVVNNTTCLERCCILIMKLHISAYNGHHQVSTVIKKSLYNLCEGVLMKRSLYINPLFTLASSVNCLYITNKDKDNKQFTLDTRVNRGLMHRDLFINTPSHRLYRLFLIIMVT